MKEKKTLNNNVWFAFGSSIAFMLSLITLAVLILGLFFSSAPARNGIFSVVFVLHFIADSLTMIHRTWLILLIVCNVFDSLYEGKQETLLKEKKLITN